MTRKAPKFQNVRVGDVILPEDGMRFVVTAIDDCFFDALYFDGTTMTMSDDYWNEYIRDHSKLIDRNKTVTVRVSK